MFETIKIVISIAFTVILLLMMITIAFPQRTPFEKAEDERRRCKASREKRNDTDK